MDLADIARLEEHRQAITLSEIAGDWLDIGGGRAARGEPGIWANIAMGMGLRGPFDPADVQRAIDWYQQAGIEPRFELCPYVDPAFIEHCSAAGLVLRSFEHVLYRTLDPREHAPQPANPDPALEIRILDRADPQQTTEYGRGIAAGFAPAATPPKREHILAYTRAAQHTRTTAMAAFINGRFAGGGAVEIAGDIASLYAASVLPQFRRRGIQQALMAVRLDLAAKRGAKLVTIGCKPGIPTERNALRLGFRVAYTKVVLIKPGPGLAPVAV